MASTKYCPSCGTKLDSSSRYCSSCGADQEGSSSSNRISREKISPKSGLAAFLLCLFLGNLGIHRFYVGKFVTGILMILTAGGLGIWYLYDLISIVCNNFTDSQGRILEISKNPSAAKTVALVIGAIFAGFFVLITSFILVILLLVSPLSDVAQKQLDAINSGDYTKAYSYNSTEFKKITSLNDFKNFIEKFPNHNKKYSMSFSRREFKNDRGELIGIFVTSEGQKIPFHYYLIKEDGQWKVLSLNITFPNEEIKKANTTNPTTQTTKPSKDLLTNTFDNIDGRYSIRYPANWEYERKGKNTIIFSGAQGTPTYSTTITIQVLGSKKYGGIYNVVHDVIDDTKKQIIKGATEVKFLEENNVTFVNPETHQKFQGRALVISYKYQSQHLKQLMVVLARNDGNAFYTFSYTAPADIFVNYFNLAKAIYNSWKIY